MESIFKRFNKNLLLSLDGVFVPRFICLKIAACYEHTP